MRKNRLIILSIAILQAAGLSVFTGFQFFSAGVRALDKALILLTVLWLTALAGIIVFYSLPPMKARLERITKKTLLLTAAGSLVAGVIFLTVSPIPRAKDPSNWQAIEIQPRPAPAGENTAGVILVQEIKLDGKPLPLEEWKNAAGWRLTESGLESIPGSAAPILIQGKGALESGAALLLGKGARYGAASIRLGWSIKEIDTYSAENETQVEMTFPAPSQAAWALLAALGLVFSAWALFLALALLTMPASTLDNLAGGMEKLAGSVTFWLAAGFLISYAAFFFRPVFLNASNVMLLENNLPSIYPIGNDMRLIIKSADFLAAGESPYAGANKYPPLAAAAFTSLLGLNYREAFRVMSTLNLFAFLFLALGLPAWLREKKKLEGFAWMLAAAGLFTYGFMFEVERGQFNLIAMGAVFLALILYHRLPKLKWPAFVLFCLGVQLKIYPAIFVLFFTRDWRDWKGNLARWAALGAANLLLLGALGWKTFTTFLSMMTGVVSGLGVTDWPVSHSVTGFVGFLGSQATLAPGLARTLQLGLNLLVIGFLALCAWSAIRRRVVLDAYLIAACTLAALTLPSLSNDYTLAFLVGPAILLFGQVQEDFDRDVRMKRLWPLAALCALAYGSTFFSYFVKPPFLQNLFPALLVMLACNAVFSLRIMSTALSGEKSLFSETKK